MRFHVVTLFPEAFVSYLDSSIIGRALREKKIKVSFYNPRDFTSDTWRRVDQKPYGGGPGMVLEAESVLRAAEKALRQVRQAHRKQAQGKQSTKRDVEIIFFDTSGKEFTNTYARTLAKKKKHLVLICGRYEGVDARVQKVLKAKKVSVGPYTLTGGELPALVVLDAVSRQVPGVLGKYESLEEERLASPEVYTRPEILVWKGKSYRVPKVLLSGNHADIEAWKQRTKRS